MILWVYSYSYEMEYEMQYEMERLLFGRAKHVEVAIRAKDVGPALRWCEDNASRLRKLESKLEFRVRERAFLEMVRANNREEVRYDDNELPLSDIIIVFGAKY